MPDEDSKNIFKSRRSRKVLSFELGLSVPNTSHLISCRETRLEFGFNEKHSFDPTDFMTIL